MASIEVTMTVTFRTGQGTAAQYLDDTGRADLSALAQDVFAHLLLDSGGARLDSHYLRVESADVQW